jgi:DNA-directed RNA polymerase subunit RPC12/RpoP
MMPSHLDLFQMMSALPQKTLKVVPAPLALDAVVDAPPVREAVSPTVEYTCGNCGAVLMRANEDKPIHALLVHCTSCDTYNSTHSE